jgi:energy-coupling factor transporter ATP-binding protein EcfA2
MNEQPTEVMSPIGRRMNSRLMALRLRSGQPLRRGSACADAESKRPSEGGQQQRFALAVAVAKHPHSVLLDEPTAALYPHGRRAVWDNIRQLYGDGLTVVISTHAMEEAAGLCGRVPVLLAQGLSNRAIAEDLVIADGTVNYLTRIIFSDIVPVVRCQ